MYRQRVSLVSKGIMILLSLIVLIFISSYAWFAPPNTPVHASGISVKTESSPDFDVAVGFPYDYNNSYGITEYASTFNLDNLHDTITDKDYSLFTYYSAKDITSDGVSSFYRPALTKDDSEGTDAKALVPSGGQGTPATPGKEYLSFDLYFRSKTPNLTVSLTSNSYVHGECEGETVNLDSFTNPTADNKSSYGDFSKDIVVGAVRASFVGFSSFTTLTTSSYKNPAYNSTPALFWLPRPDVYLNATTDAQGSTSWNAITGDNITSDMDTSTHHYYKLENNVWTHKTYSSSADSFFVAGDLDNNELVTLSNKSGDYYYNKIHVNLWIEGSDKETRRAISGGKFFFKLEFTSH